MSNIWIENFYLFILLLFKGGRNIEDILIFVFSGFYLYTAGTVKIVQTFLMVGDQLVSSKSLLP